MAVERLAGRDCRLAEAVNLPIFSGMRQDEIRYVIETVEEL
jgi:hypothetical protein